MFAWYMLDPCDVLASVRVVDVGEEVTPRTELRLLDLHLEIQAALQGGDDGPAVESECCSALIRAEQGGLERRPMAGRWQVQEGGSLVARTADQHRVPLPPCAPSLSAPSPSADLGAEEVWESGLRFIRHHGREWLTMLDEGRASAVVRPGQGGVRDDCCSQQPLLLALPPSQAASACWVPACTAGTTRCQQALP